MKNFLKTILMLSTLLGMQTAHPLWSAGAGLYMFGIIGISLQRTNPSTIQPVYNTHLPSYPLTPLKTPGHDTTFQLLNHPQTNPHVVAPDPATLLTPLPHKGDTSTTVKEVQPTYTPAQLKTLEAMDHATRSFGTQKKKPVKK